VVIITWRLSKKVWLSNFTVWRRIENMNYNTECELIKQIKSWCCFAHWWIPWFCQSVLLAFVGHIYKNQADKEILMCKALPTHRRRFISLIWTWLKKKRPSLKRMCLYCTEVAQSMVAHFKATAPECTSSHCIMHCQAIPDRKLPHAVLDEVMKTRFYECGECIWANRVHFQ
jgi:hypothetical protein